MGSGKEMSPEDSPNLYLVGFMGTGKSVLGRRLAERLGMKFVDSDREIEKKESMKVKEIFEKFGEDRFRELEKAFIESGHSPTGCVVSCGGGLVCREGMPELVKGKGVCVSLFSSSSEILERVSKNKNRPILNVENPLERIEELLKLRTPFYMRSGVSIATDKDLDVTEERILRIYKSRCKNLVYGERVKNSRASNLK